MVAKLPQKTRVQLIAAVLLVFTGTEIFVLAPYVFDIALMIDVGGMVIVVAALRSSVSVSMMQLRALVTAVVRPLLAVLKVGEMVGDYGSALSPGWYRTCFFVDRITTRCSAAFLVVSIGLVLTKALIANP